MSDGYQTYITGTNGFLSQETPHGNLYTHLLYKSCECKSLAQTIDVLTGELKSIARSRTQKNNLRRRALKSLIKTLQSEMTIWAEKFEPKLKPEWHSYSFKFDAASKPPVVLSPEEQQKQVIVRHEVATLIKQQIEDRKQEQANCTHRHIGSVMGSLRGDPYTTVIESTSRNGVVTPAYLLCQKCQANLDIADNFQLWEDSVAFTKAFGQIVFSPLLEPADEFQPLAYIEDARVEPPSPTRWQLFKDSCKAAFYIKARLNVHLDEDIHNA